LAATAAAFIRPSVVASSPFPRSDARISGIGRYGDDADPVPTAAATASDPTSESRPSY
jgi:hypothetical protein